MFRSKTFTAHTGRSKRARGFTIVELVVVLLIIAIIAAFMLPQAIAYIKKYRLGVASRNVATALQRARYLATSNNRRAGVLIQAAQRIDIEEYDPAGEKDPESKGAFQLPDGVTFAPDVPRQIAFDGRGVVTPLPKDSPTIRLDSESGYYTVVTVSPTGQVTISDPLRKDDDI